MAGEGPQRAWSDHRFGGCSIRSPDRKTPWLFDGHTLAVQSMAKVSPGRYDRRPAQPDRLQDLAITRSHPHSLTPELRLGPESVPPAHYGLELLDLHWKADFATQAFDPGAQPPHHGGQLEGAEVGAMQAEDVGVGTTATNSSSTLAPWCWGSAPWPVELSHPRK